MRHTRWQCRKTHEVDCVIGNNENTIVALQDYLKRLPYPLSQRCDACGRTNPPENTFCGGCGGALRPGPATVEVASAAAPPLPEAFADGRYRVMRFLGEGARKRVYLARDERLEREVAVASIRTDGLVDAGRTRVQREARAMARLGDHPHVVMVHDIIEDDGEILLISQYMAGGDLAEKIAAGEGGRLAPGEAVRLAAQVCQALEHAHTNDVIHRDVKPENVWLTEDGTAKLGDFGLAHSQEQFRVTQEGTMVGTVAYMAPEQALGKTPDARGDLYALGAMLYEMATGRPPFLGEDVVAVISQHINTPPVAPSWHVREIAKPLETLILSLLEKDPAARPASAADVCETLTSDLRNRSVCAALCLSITAVGEILGKPLPRADDDVNELPDALVLMD